VDQITIEYTFCTPLVESPQSGQTLNINEKTVKIKTKWQSGQSLNINKKGKK
jgi:hypothetical protein